MRRSGIGCAAAVGLLAIAAAARVAAAELPADHPFVGTWKFAIPQLDCTETYTFRRDGTALVRSAGEVSETTYEIAAKPSARGFYKWDHTIVKTNGRKDCAGEVMEPGSTVSQYVFFHRSPDVFFICGDETGRNCIGPFVRQKGQGV
ncbi:MAG: hypothetical protein U1F58_09825 [Burkholderiales bacterium]